MKDTDSFRILTSIFKKNDWFSKDEEENVYNAFCDLLEILEPNERCLLLELTDRYSWITGAEYDKYIKDIFREMPPDVFSGIKNLFIFPVVKPTDEGKTKSGKGVAYDIKSMLPTINVLRGITPKVLEDFDGFSQAPGSKENELLCLVDDFIGTGETLRQCLSEISKKMKINYKKIIVISISCQKDTYKTLQEEGIKIFTKIQVTKGITDHNIESEISKKKSIMRIIEESIPGSKSFSLGYQESEAIVTLKRTPDNTFPIFWKKTRKQGKWINAPFLRED